ACAPWRSWSWQVRSLRRHDPDQVRRSGSADPLSAGVPPAPVLTPDATVARSAGWGRPIQVRRRRSGEPRCPSRQACSVAAVTGRDGEQIRRRLATARVYLCTDARRDTGDLAEFAEAALAGGVDIIQLRDK